MKNLRSVLLCSFVALFFCANSVSATDFSQITDDATVISALNQLESIGQTNVLNVLEGKNLTNKPIKIVFKNLSRTPYGACDAVLLKTLKGSLLVCINDKHINAPIETIACLIAHESVHNTCTGTFDEELRAWVTETKTWMIFVQREPVLKYDSSRLTTRLNYLSSLYSPEDQSNTSIKNVLANIPAYKHLKRDSVN